MIGLPENLFYNFLRFSVFYSVGKDPHRYAVQGSDTTMLSSAFSLDKKTELRKSRFSGMDN